MIRKVLVLWIVIVTAFFAEGPFRLAGRLCFGTPVAYAQEAGWKEEYDSVCSKTDVAMSLSAEELKTLIARCDRLKSRIEAEEETTRKIYRRRLQMCRDLYQYVLENKERN
jgi:hypothetical protein